MDKNVRVIAYYLPQFHPFKENNEWWGEGFTEWTNVAKAKPLFWGHKQPKIPKDLGFYDLRLAEIQKAQVELAKEAGVYGFCYWHYWFGEGRQLMEKPLLNVVANKDIDFPFCLGWANESWYAKIWNNEHSLTGKMLMEQQYPGKEDIVAHLNTIKSIVADSRYIRIENRPVFLIYRPYDIPDFELLKSTFNYLVKEAGIADSFFFIAHSLKEKDNVSLIASGYDAVNMMRQGAYRYDYNCVKNSALRILIYKTFNYPLRLRYKNLIKYFIKESDVADTVFPAIVPNWDHTPRSGRKGVVFEGSTPALFKKHVKMVLDVVRRKKDSRKVIFLKSWNEWGEGNYMEPDMEFGKGYINVLREALDE